MIAPFYGGRTMYSGATVFSQLMQQLPWWRFQISRSRSDSLRLGFEHDRSLHDALSLGAFPADEKRREDAHATQSLRQYPRVHPDNRGERARCECSRPHHPVAGSLLCDGQSLPRFRAALHAAYAQSLFRHPCQKELSVSPPIFAPRGSKPFSAPARTRSKHRFG